MSDFYVYNQEREVNSLNNSSAQLPVECQLYEL